MTTPKNFSSEAISLFVELCLSCVEEDVGTLEHAFIQKAAERIKNASAPLALGFAELCLMENAGETLPEDVYAALKKSFEEYEKNIKNSIDALRVQAKKAEEYAKECRTLICKQEIKTRYIRNALRSFPSSC